MNKKRDLLIKAKELYASDRDYTSYICQAIVAADGWVCGSEVPHTDSAEAEELFEQIDGILDSELSIEWLYPNNARRWEEHFPSPNVFRLHLFDQLIAEHSSTNINTN